MTQGINVSLLGAIALLPGILVLAIVGYLHLVWWIPVFFGLAALLAYEIATGLRAVVSIRSPKSGFIIRHLIEGALLLLLFWSIGYGLSFLL